MEQCNDIKRWLSLSAQFIDPIHNWWPYITITAKKNYEFVSEHLQQIRTNFHVLEEKKIYK